MSIKSWVGHLLRELKMYTQPRGEAGKRLIIFPCTEMASSSGMLWGSCLAVELRKLGWTVNIIPMQVGQSQRKRLLKWFKPDLGLMIKCRHKLNAPASYDLPIVFIIDDADYVDPNLRPKVEQSCRDSVAVVAGNKKVRDWCGQYNDNAHVVWVSHPAPPTPPTYDHQKRENRLVWAHAEPFNYPAELKFVNGLLEKLTAKRTDFIFRIHGVRDQAVADKFVKPYRDMGVKIEYQPFMPSYEAYLNSIREGAVGIHPVCLESAFSEGKSFGKILSYICAGVPVVTHDVLDHAIFFTNDVNGKTPMDEQGYADAIDDLFNDPAKRNRLAEQAYTDFLEKLTTESCARQVNEIIQKVM